MSTIGINISLKCLHAIIINLKAVHVLNACFSCNGYCKITNSL